MGFTPANKGNKFSMNGSVGYVIVERDLCLYIRSDKFNKNIGVGYVMAE